MRAVILAGGKGTRLAPYTVAFPKPLMPLDDVPILEIVVRQLKHHGFTRLTMAVGYLAQLLRAFFDNGSRFGVDIDYSLETEPLAESEPLESEPPAEDEPLETEPPRETDRLPDGEETETPVMAEASANKQEALPAPEVDILRIRALDVMSTPGAGLFPEQEERGQMRR